MQTGNRNEFAAQMGLASPSISRSTAKPNAAHHHQPKPVFPDAAEIAREDSWGSRSGDTDSPTTDQMTPNDPVPAPVIKTESGSAS